jgi:hypothetical protein
VTWTALTLSTTPLTHIRIRPTASQKSKPIATRLGVFAMTKTQFLTANNVTTFPPNPTFKGVPPKSLRSSKNQMCPKFLDPLSAVKPAKRGTVLLARRLGEVGALGEVGVPPTSVAFGRGSGGQLLL